MTSLLRRQLEASLELENDPGIRAFRSINKRRTPDLSNTSDTDVLEWLQRVEMHAAEFYDQYAQHPSLKVYDDAAPELCDLAKRFIKLIQELQKVAGNDV